MSPFEDGEVVWVKWGSCWWPGEVWSENRVPEDIIASLRKPVIAFVKFFQEGSFEYVRNLNNIMKYNCDQKMEHIKRGMDKHKASKKMMTNFPADVLKAEQLTGGNANILSNLETPTKSAPATPSKSLAGSPATAITKKPAGAYNSSTKVQLTTSPAPKSDKKFTCTMCNFATERMNLLMFHIKNHSSTSTFTPRVSDPPPVETKKITVTKTPSKKTANDSIADDVRKIKESMKKEKEPKVLNKRAPKASPATGRAPRGAKKVPKVEETENEVESEKKVEEKPAPANELKTKLLADWSDDDDDANEKGKVKELPVSLPTPPLVKAPTISPEKSGETSRSIRNIPKKQRISEVYIQPEPVKVEEPVELAKTEVPLPVALPVKKPAVKATKRKNTGASIEVSNDLETKKLVEEKDDTSLLVATAELLNETEVPKVENAQQPSPTFHKSNDIDKRNLPPKERNKRIFRAKTESEAQSNNGTTKEEPISSPIQNELMLPHKKKQSSRLLTAEKPLLVEESKSPRRKLKSGGEIRTAEAFDVDVSSSIEEKTEPAAVEAVQRQSPMREDVTTPPISSPKRGQKRHNSDEPESAPEPKKLQKSDSETSQGRTIFACASKACITSKGELAVTNQDSPITTQANSVTVTSHVIITEATNQSLSSSEVVSTPKMALKIPAQSLKNALKVPAEKLLEMKKQGLVKVGLDMKHKLTEKGKMAFKETQSKSIDERSPTPPPPPTSQAPVVEEPERIKSPEPPSPKESTEVPESPMADEPKAEQADEDRKHEPDEPEVPNGCSEPVTPAEDSTNKKDAEKEPISVAPASPAKDSVPDSIAAEPVENGKEPETDSSEDPSNGGAGLIALQAETFGGPPNCFYLCRQVEDRYEPVDNQILVLNAQNALVPYEGDMAEDGLTSVDAAPENLAAYPQLSPNSNIIINTPNGQKIELNHFTILALQEQADENGNASIELSGEQLELNINMILEAINAQQQEQTDVMLIDGEGSLLLDPTDIPVEIHHSATQVSETLSKPIMSTTVAPEIGSTKVTISETVSKNLNIEDSLASIGVTTQNQRSNVPKSLELPITVTNPTIAETVNHRKLANAPIIGELMDVTGVASDTFVVQSATAADNGSED